MELLASGSGVIGRYRLHGNILTHLSLVAIGKHISAAPLGIYVMVTIDDGIVPAQAQSAPWSRNGRDAHGSRR